MCWTIEFEERFAEEFEALPGGVQDELIAHLDLLKKHGPALGRPYADTLTASKYPNLKELRFNAEHGVWRVAFAFDPERKGVLLVAGDKAGVNEKRFYKSLIATAEKRYAAHLDTLS